MSASTLVEETLIPPDVDEPKVEETAAPLVVEETPVPLEVEEPSVTPEVEETPVLSELNEATFVEETPVEAVDEPSILQEPVLSEPDEVTFVEETLVEAIDDKIDSEMGVELPATEEATFVEETPVEAADNKMGSEMGAEVSATEALPVQVELPIPVELPVQAELPVPVELPATKALPVQVELPVPVEPQFVEITPEVEAEPVDTRSDDEALERESELASSIATTRLLVEALRKRVEEVEGKVSEMEADATTRQSTPPPAAPKVAKRAPSPVNVRKTLSLFMADPRRTLTDGLASWLGGAGDPQTISGIPSYVLLVSLGVCAVVLKVVLKKAVEVGARGRR
jgi:hypothetical protein